MPLSTSSSERPDPLASAHTARPGLRRATIIAIASAALILLGAEALSRYAFPRISQIESRIVSDEREIRSIHPANPIRFRRFCWLEIRCSCVVSTIPGSGKTWCPVPGYSGTS